MPGNITRQYLGIFLLTLVKYIQYLRSKNQQDALFYSQFISINNLDMFRAGLLLIISI